MVSKKEILKDGINKIFDSSNELEDEYFFLIHSIIIFNLTYKRIMSNENVKSNSRAYIETYNTIKNKLKNICENQLNTFCNSDFDEIEWYGFRDKNNKIEG